MNVIALEVNQKYYTTIELKNMGYSYYKIGQMEENGQLHRINRTTYENLSYKGDENDFINAAAYVPDGVICLMSAARYYELTNFLPDVIDVAIDRKKKVSTLPDWPEIKIFYFDPSRMDSILILPVWIPVSRKSRKAAIHSVSLTLKRPSLISSTTAIKSALRKHQRYCATT